uniref:Interleukin 17F n=1 Tax=Xenopus tropicalis TaxID=8364 RepID=F6WPR3_XENTR
MLRDVKSIFVHLSLPPQVSITLLGINTMPSAHPHVPQGDCQLPADASFPAVVRASIRSGGQIQSLRMEMRNRSLSPWDYVNDQDNNRYPNIIYEAKCRHAGCLDSQGNMDARVNSIPIRQEILVLRREMIGCTPSFRLEKKMVTVGCTCARPIVQHLI